MNEWISVNDRLPEDGVCVLAITSGGYFYSCRYSWEYKDWTINCHCEGGFASSSPEDFDEEVTHWMHLPPLPKENE